MIFEGLSQNILKLVAGEGLSDALPNLTKFLKPGMLLQGTVFKSFPNENKAVIQLDSRQVTVETPEPLTPGRSFSVRVEKVSPQPVLKVIAQDVKQSPHSPQLNDKNISAVKQTPDVTTRISSNKFSVPQQLTAGEIKSLNIMPGQKVMAKVIHVSSAATATVKILGKEVMAHFKYVVPPKPGTVVELSVDVHKGEFRLVGKEGTVSLRPVEISNIKSLLPAKEPFHEMVQKLDDLIKSLEQVKILASESDAIERLVKTLKLLKPQVMPDGVKIKEQVDLSGINYEAKVKRFCPKVS